MEMCKITRETDFAERLFRGNGFGYFLYTMLELLHRTYICPAQMNQNLFEFVYNKKST